MYTAILGGKAKVETLTGSVAITIPAGTDNGKVLRLKGLGMPNYNNNSQSGNLYATVNLTTPKNLSEEEMQLVKKLQSLRQPEPATA